MEQRVEEEESLEKFLIWAAELGITDSSTPKLSQSEPQPSHSSSCLGKSLTVSHFPDSGGRGLAAARDLTKHELVLTVPKSALVTTESLILKDKKLSVSIRRYPNLSSTQILSVCLLAEMGKGRSSWWNPYLMQLPRSYDTLASFARFETQALQVDDAIWAAEKAISKAESDWKEALPLMGELEFKHQLLTFRSWLWASATISTRTMHIPWDEAGCLCPVGDFFNYAAPGEDSICSEEEESCVQFSSLRVSSSSKDEVVEGKLDPRPVDGHSQRLTDASYEEDAGAYCFYARRDYRKGEQVLLSYGTYTNLELLEHYGFILTTNPNEKIYIQLEPDVYSNSWPKESLYIQPDGNSSYALLCALRLWATPPNKRKYVGHLAYSGQQLSRENEIHVMRWLENKCCFLLDNMPSSIEEDIWLLDFADKLQCSPLNGGKQMPLACEVEVAAFAKANGLQTVGEFSFSNKAKRSLERWKLAIRWRLRLSFNFQMGLCLFSAVPWKFIIFHIESNNFMHCISKNLRNHKCFPMADMV